MKIRTKWIILLGALIVVGAVNLRINFDIPGLGKNYSFNSDNIDKEAVKDYAKEGLDIVTDAIVPEDSKEGKEVAGYVKEGISGVAEFLGDIMNVFKSPSGTSSDSSGSGRSTIQDADLQNTDAVQAEPQEKETISAADTTGTEQTSISLTPCTVVKVIDGDTIKASFGNGASEVKIRLIGIDTPESVHSDSSRNNEYGVMASDYTKSLLLEGTTIYVEYDEEMTDKYGRTLAYVWLTEDTTDTANMLNAHLVAAGYAYDKVYQPNDKYAETFTVLRCAAQESKTGLWQYPEFAALWQ